MVPTAGSPLVGPDTGVVRGRREVRDGAWQKLIRPGPQDEAGVPREPPHLVSSLGFHRLQEPATPGKLCQKRLPGKSYRQIALGDSLLVPRVDLVREHEVVVDHEAQLVAVFVEFVSFEEPSTPKPQHRLNAHPLSNTKDQTHAARVHETRTVPRISGRSHEMGGLCTAEVVPQPRWRDTGLKLIVRNRVRPFGVHRQTIDGEEKRAGRPERDVDRRRVGQRLLHQLDNAQTQTLIPRLRAVIR